MTSTAPAAPVHHQLVTEPYAEVARAFGALFRSRSDGGGALAVMRHGTPVLDIWAGYADIDTGRMWRSDTMAMSFSTTKGVASTLVHRLVAKGVLDPALPVATWWPAFAAAGKDDITLADVMTHRSGLHRVRGVADEPSHLLDHRRMAAYLAAREPHPVRGKPAYHAMTYGYLIAAIVEHATGRDWTDLVDEELRQPLGVTGLHVSTHVDHHERIAPFFERMAPFGLDLATIGHWVKKVERFRPAVDALLPHGFDDFVNTPELWSAVIPAANGVFDARSLARMYAPLASGGVLDGQQFLPADVVEAAGKVQTRARDRVLGFRMRWRLGYHQAFTTDRDDQPRMAFGHFGLGGSGAFADPETGISMAFVTNKMGRGTTPIADSRLPKLAAHAIRAARLTS